MKHNLNKKIGIVVVVTLLSVWFWLSIKPLIDNPGNITQTSSWLPSLIALLVLSPLLVLALAIFEKRLWSLGIAAAVLLPFLLVFGIDQFYGAAVILMTLLFMYADKEIEKEIKLRIKLDGRIIMQKGLGLVITPLLILISFAYFFSPAVQSSAQKQELPPAVNRVVNVIVENFFNQEFQKLPLLEQGRVKNRLVKEIIGQFNNFLGPYFRYLPPILAFALFLVLQSLRFLIVWIATISGMLIFWIAKKTSFIKLVEKNVKMEELVSM